MMSVLEYADDVNKTVEEILKKCKELNIKVSEADDLLDDEAITLLDNEFENIDESLELDEERLDDIAEEMTLDNKINADQTVKKQKLKKKSVQIKSNKKDFAKKKKEMYKNKEKLVSNAPNNDEKVVLYKENMTIGALADVLRVSPAELIKKLFSLGIMANINNMISFER